MEYDDDVSRELIKCVVVGDTAVGKTRLICAKTCGQRLGLEQLMTVHVPTVWAIDQYRICKDVLEKSFDVVDGVNVSLRLWDTFGDHNNDRCFAYGRSDVVLLCFSIASPRSLEHARSVWYPEIRRMCPNIPVLLVACKVDLRHLCLQPDFQQLLARRRPSPLKPIRIDHIVYPEQGRAVAKEIGAFYYETSIFTHFGIEDVYMNAIRAALCRRRQARLWLGSSFQSVKYPQIQMPYQPPKPDPPSIKVLQSHLVNDLIFSFAPDCSQFSDCVIHVKDKSYYCHKLMLSAGSKYFYQLFICSTLHCHNCHQEKFQCVDEETSTNCSDVLFLDSHTVNSWNNLHIDLSEPHKSKTTKPMREIEFELLRLHGLNNSCHSNRSSICSSYAKQQQHSRKNATDNGHCSKMRLSSTDSVNSTHSNHRKPPLACQHARNLNALLTLPDYVTSLKVEQNLVHVTLDDKKLKPEAVLACIDFIYSGDGPPITDKGFVDYDDLIIAADIFQLKHLIVYLTIRQFGCDFSEFSYETAKREFLVERNVLLAELGFELSLFSGMHCVQSANRFCKLWVIENFIKDEVAQNTCLKLFFYNLSKNRLGFISNRV